MKKLLGLSILLVMGLFTSCDKITKVYEEDKITTIEVEKGDRSKIEIPLNNNSGLSKNSSEFNEMVNIALKKAKTNLKNEYSFTPIEIMFINMFEPIINYQGDTIPEVTQYGYILEYAGANSYGAMGELKDGEFIYIDARENNKVISNYNDIDDVKIDLTLLDYELKFWTDDRDLVSMIDLSGNFTDGVFRFINGWKILSSDVDNLTIEIELENGSKINIPNEMKYARISNNKYLNVRKLLKYKNNFNESLANNLIITTDDKKYVIPLPNNRKDYFKQLVKLMEVYG